ncbi:MAG: alpha/beta hydrolase [Lachnospiraceae bacterium]|nr:alpha/beta hydrolase [Lachnospiraceae bacterium]
MFAEVNGIKLFYEKLGSGRPLIMVHGNGEDHTIFKEAADILQEKYTCYLLDSRCHGQSSSSPELHYEDMAQDMIAFMEVLDLRDVIFYGFSDGGIIGLMAASHSDRITTLITSGANVKPEGVKKSLRILFRVMYFFKKDPKTALMMNEPHISDKELSSITARTLIIAGSKDLILPEETRHIAITIPGAKMKILHGENHGSYIIHKTKVAELIAEFAN